LLLCTNDVWDILCAIAIFLVDRATYMAIGRVLRLKSFLRLSRRLEYKSSRVNRPNAYESMRVHERDNNIYTFKHKTLYRTFHTWYLPKFNQIWPNVFFREDFLSGQSQTITVYYSHIGCMIGKRYCYHVYVLSSTRKHSDD
jgi:hypothetical protein